MTGKSHTAISVHLPSDGQRQPGADAATVNGNTDEDIQYTELCRTIFFQLHLFPKSAFLLGLDSKDLHLCTRFCRAMLCRARWCHSMSSVCPSVCNVQVPWSHRWDYFQNKIHVQMNTKSVQCLCTNTKHNKVRITQSLNLKKTRLLVRFCLVKGTWGRQMARPWKPPVGHNSYLCKKKLPF